MQLVERHLIKPNHELYGVLDDLTFKAKNLYNHGLYLYRQSYFERKKNPDKPVLSWVEIDKDLRKQGHETMLHNASYLDPSSSDYETRHAYQRYRIDPRSRQTAPQRIAAAVNSAFGVEAVSLSDSTQLEEWYMRWNLWNTYGPAVLWCLTLATDSDNTPRRDGAFLRIFYFWVRRHKTQATRKEFAPHRMKEYFESSQCRTLEEYEKYYAPLYLV